MHSLFEDLDRVQKYDDRLHLASLTALLGPPPKDLLNLGRRTSQFYDADGEPNSLALRRF